MIEVRTGSDRFCTRTGWLTSWHSFSYGQWYDPDNLGFGPLVVLNHDVLAPGAGFEPHRHSGVDLVTYVVAGALAHQDSTGTATVVGAGELQVLRSGDGVTHSERNASDVEPVEYVQMWLRPGDPQSSYSGPRRSDTPVQLGERELTVAVLATSSTLGASGPSHLYVLAGALTTAAGAGLAAGDAVRADTDVVVVASAASTVLLWTL